MWIFYGNDSITKWIIRIFLGLVIVFVIMAEGIVPTLLTLFVSGVVLGCILLYDSYRKEQKTLEPPKSTEGKKTVHKEDAKSDPLKDFADL